MKKYLFKGMLVAVMAMLALTASADSSVTLSSSKKNMTGANSFTVSLKNGAYLNDEMIEMPKGKSTQFTVTYGHSDKVITKIAFKWNKVPDEGTVSSNYGTFSYPSTWTAPSGGIKSVRFSSNGKSQARLKQITIYYKSASGSSDSGSTSGSGSTTSSKRSSYDKNAPIGWATVGGSTTGSSNKNKVTVTSKDALLKALSGTDAKTIYVKGTITFSGVETVKDAANKTVYGLPGSVLSNPTHSSTVSKSGILNFSRCKNIILRNLTFKSAGAYDIDGNDNLQLQACDYIWVDHCDFQDGVDGNFDCNNGSDHIAVTWCRFRYLIKPWAGGSGGSDDHRNCCLWGGSDNNTKDKGHLNTTFANCWWDSGCHERMPRVRFGKVHVLNCLFSCTGNNYCIGAAYASNIYAEKNAFVNVKNPWKCYATKSGKTDYNITMTGNKGASDEQKRSGSNSYFKPSSYYSYSSMDASKVQGEVSKYAGATLSISEGGSVSAKAASFDEEPEDEEVTATGIETAESSTEVKSVTYYSVNGAKIPELQQGVNIVRTTYTDGTVKTAKVIKK